MLAGMVTAARAASIKAQGTLNFIPGSFSIILFATCLLLSFLHQSSGAATSVISDIIEPNEAVLKQLVAYALESYKNTASLQRCPCSKLACDAGAKFPSGVCNATLEFGSKVFTESNCSLKCSQRKVDMTQGSVWRALKSARDDWRSRIEACWTQALDGRLRSSLLANLHSVRWQYFATPSGLFRIFPGIPQSDDTCQSSPFDATLRPWYVAAISGRKNVIMVLDVSDSMNDFGRLPRLKRAAQAVLNALENFDHVGIIAFGKTADVLLKDYGILQLVNQTTRSALLQAVASITAAGGGTNYEAAFRRAFRMIDDSRHASNKFTCNTVILFVTDGVPTLGERNEEKLLSMIKDLDQRSLESSARIFSYVLGKSTTATLPKRMACATRGLFTHVKDGEEFSESLTLDYAKFFSSLITAAHVSKPVWVEPYIDRGGLGYVTSVSQPVYDNDFTLLGVLGMDVSVSDLREAANNSDSAWKSVINTLASRANCSSIDDRVAECALNALRQVIRPGEQSALCDVEEGEELVCKNVRILKDKTIPELYFSQSDRSPPSFCKEQVNDSKLHNKFCCANVSIYLLSNKSDSCHLNADQFQVFTLESLNRTQTSGISLHPTYSVWLIAGGLICSLYTVYTCT